VTKYLVPQRDRYDAVAVSTLRDGFLVEVWNGSMWVPDPRTPRAGEVAPKRRRRRRATPKRRAT